MQRERAGERLRHDHLPHAGDGENPAKYGWYLQMVRDGIPASAGFGIGLERFTRYVAGLDSVWQASAYPKVPGVASP